MESTSPHWYKKKNQQINWELNEEWYIYMVSKYLLQNTY